MHQTEIQPADPAARRRAVRIGAAVALIGAAAVWLVDRRLERALDPLAAGGDPAAAMATVLAAGAVLGLGLLAIALWMVAFARRIEQAERFPPPGTRVVQDTAVRHGAAARRLAYGLYAGALVLFVGGVAIPWTLWRLLESLAGS